MLTKMSEHVGKLEAHVARAPLTPSGSSVTEHDSDPDKDGSGTVSFYVPITVAWTDCEQSPPWPDVPARDTIMNVHFKNLVLFCDSYPPTQHAYQDFLYAQPTMDPQSFKSVTRRLCQVSDTILFLIKCLSFHMALVMGRKMKNNQIFVEYLEAASGNFKKAREFIGPTADELCDYQIAEEEQSDSSKFYYVLQFTLLMKYSD
jgi:hypothetical protein